jgi:hypothetical protein
MAAPKGNKFAEGNKGGRPTAYRPEFAERAKNLCQLGAVDVEIADFFGVTVQTIHNWRAAHQEFFEATRVGKEYADNRIERSFYQRAVGYEYDLVKTVRRNKNGLTVTETIKHVPGDVTAQMKWLCNRMPHKWRHKVDVSHEVGQSEDTGCVAIANMQRGHPRRFCSRHPRRELPSKLRGAG